MKNVLGTGIRFPLAINQHGGLATSAAVRDVEEAIHIILFTRRGERVTRPDFGTRLYDYVLAPMNATTLSAIQAEVDEALSRWEPRIHLEQINVRPQAGNRPGALAIEVHYRLRDSGSLHHKVFPFHLAGEG